MKLTRTILAFLAAMPVAASAEVLRVEGLYPARSDGAAAQRAIAVESFGGVDGPLLSLRIEDALREVRIEGRPWFQILPGGGRAAAVLRGTADTEVTVIRYTQEREECAAKDAGGKCVEKKKVDVPCTKRRFDLTHEIRLVSPGGTLLYSDDQAEFAETSFCRGDSGEPKPRAAVVRELAARIAASTRLAFAPEFRSEAIRVDESRKNLPRDLADRFKQAVRLTKSDTGAACREWDAIAQASPSHAPTLFNTALCAESAGDLASADQRYRQIGQIEPRNGNASDGLQRLAARARASRQLEAHGRN